MVQTGQKWHWCCLYPCWLHQLMGGGATDTAENKKEFYGAGSALRSLRTPCLQNLLPPLDIASLGTEPWPDSSHHSQTIAQVRWASAGAAGIQHCECCWQSLVPLGVRDHWCGLVPRLQVGDRQCGQEVLAEPSSVKLFILWRRRGGGATCSPPSLSPLFSPT